MSERNYKGELIGTDWARIAEFGATAADKLSPAALDMTASIDKWLEANVAFQDAIAQAQETIEARYGKALPEMEQEAGMFLKSKQLLEEIEQTSKHQVETVNHWLIKIVNTTKRTGPYHKKALDEILTILSGEQLKQAQKIVEKFGKLETQGVELQVEHAPEKTGGVLDTVNGWLSSLINGMISFFGRAVDGLKQIVESPDSAEGNQIGVEQSTYNELVSTVAESTAVTEPITVEAEHSEVEAGISTVDKKIAMSALAKMLGSMPFNQGTYLVAMKATNPRIATAVVNSTVKVGGLQIASKSLNAPIERSMIGKFDVRVGAMIYPFEAYNADKIVTSLKNGTFEDEGWGKLRSVIGIRRVVTQSIRALGETMLPELLEELKSLGIPVPEKVKVHIETKGPDEANLGITFESPVETVVASWECPHCKQAIDETNLETDGKNWFHKACMDKGPVDQPKQETLPNPVRQKLDYGGNTSFAKRQASYRSIKLAIAPPRWLEQEDLPLWDKASAIAEAHGRAEEFGAVLSIFKRLKGAPAPMEPAIAGSEKTADPFLETPLRQS